MGYAVNSENNGGWSGRSPDNGYDNYWVPSGCTMQVHSLHHASTHGGKVHFNVAADGQGGSGYPLLCYTPSTAATAIAGWSLEAGMYGAETSPCNVGEYVANVQAGDGYYLDPGVNGGWCKTVPAANVETVREDIGTDNWQSHATGVTYLPHSAATELRWKFTEGVGGNANGIRLAEISLYAAEQAGECTMERAPPPSPPTPGFKPSLPPSLPPSLGPR